MVINYLKKKDTTISGVDYDKRVLLISHCLRPHDKCPAKLERGGLNCIGCSNNCSVGKLKKMAQELGYRGICIAPGGSMAIKFVEENQPEGIIAVACEKELREGICAIKKIALKNKFNGIIPVIKTIPLIRDGCVDTEIDVEKALQTIKTRQGH